MNWFGGGNGDGRKSKTYENEFGMPNGRELSPNTRDDAVNCNAGDDA
jgi:hypothetical protein